MLAGIAGLFRRLADRLQPQQQPGRPRGTPQTVAAPGAKVEEIMLPEVGPCIVRGLILRDRLDLATRRSDGYANAARMMQYCVLNEDRSQIHDADGWEAYATLHFEACVDALNRAQRLSGMLDDEPGDEAPPKS